MLVDSALICIQRTQVYSQAYLDFKFKQEADQSFGALIVFFNDAENNRNGVITEAGSLGYGMVATDSPFDDNDATQQFRRTLTDFAATITTEANDKKYTDRSNTAANQQQQMATTLQQMQ